MVSVLTVLTVVVEAVVTVIVVVEVTVVIVVDFTQVPHLALQTLFCASLSWHTDEKRHTSGSATPLQ